MGVGPISAPSPAGAERRSSLKARLAGGSGGATLGFEPSDVDCMFEGMKGRAKRFALADCSDSTVILFPVSCFPPLATWMPSVLFE